MRTFTNIIFYDGVVSKPHQAEISPLDQDSVQIRYQDKDTVYTKRYSYQSMTLIGALGQTNPVVELQDDARIEFLEKNLPDWFLIKHKNVHHKIWKFERSPVLIIVSVFVVIAFVISILKWGIPAAAHVVAFELPENTISKLGDQAQGYVFELTEKSHLPVQQQTQIQQDYLKMVAQGRPAKLIFRAGGKLGANALALPNNTIIVTDELVEMAHSDQEILGVLAHEQGHLIERHSLQQALSGLGFSVIYIAITGDSSDILHSLPSTLLGAGYSRKFEQQADLYALNLMQKNHLQTSHYANFLQRLSEESGEEKQKNSIMDFLSSHPATEKRIKMVREFEDQHPTKK